MRLPLTFDAVDRFRRLLGYEWRGPWQQETVEAICSSREVVFQAARQVAGKTWTVGLLGAVEIASGGTITIGYPSMAQATRLLSEQVIANLKAIHRTMSAALGRPFFKRPKDQTTYQRWALADTPEHEGKFYALSANEITRSKPEGYTTDHLYLDESHRLTEKTLGVFEPFLDIAESEGRARCVYMGVGGHKSSLIERKKAQPGVVVVRWPASRIAAADPRWASLFDQRKASLPPWQYRMHYECEPATEGMRLMYETIPGPLDFASWRKRGLLPGLRFGIDVGKIVDSTVVKVIEVIPSDQGVMVNEVDTFEISGISYVDQAKAIYEWINARFRWRPEWIVVELNGVGEAFYDILNSGPFHGLRGMFTTADLKEQFWHMTVCAIREGRFGVVSEVARAQYEGLAYENVYRGGRFVVEFEHSDYWMALCMAYMALLEIEAIR